MWTDCHQEGNRTEVGLPSMVENEWVLDFMWERFHDMSSGDLESMFITAGDSETQEGLKIEEARS